MAKILLLKKYNNYFNRIIKGYSDLSDYMTAVGTGNYELDTQINFNPNDNVSAELIINDCPFDADYLIVADDTTSDIISRWFILEAKRTRKGQYALSLRRDVIFDYQTELADSPIYIQKAVLQEDDPFILNSEGMSFNEIKTEETLLKDASQSAWLVAYTAKGQALTDGHIQAITQNPEYLTASQVASKMGISLSDFNKILDGTLNHYVNSRIQFSISVDAVQVQPVVWVNADESFNKISQDALNAYFRTRNDCFGKFSSGTGFISLPATASLFGTRFEANKTGIKNEWNLISGQSYLSNESYNVLNKMAADKTIILINGAYKQIKLTANSTVNQTKKILATSGTALYSLVSGFISDYNANPAFNNIIDVDYAKGKVYVLYTEVEFTITLEDADLADVDLTISASRNACEDAIYDMIVMPFNNVVVNGGGYTMETFTGANNLKLMQDLAVKNDAKIYDIQLLPYCPVVQVNTDGSFIDLDSLSVGIDYDFITQDIPTNYHEYQVPYASWTTSVISGGVRTTIHYTPTITGSIQSFSLRFEYLNVEYEDTFIGTPSITNQGTASNPDLYVLIDCIDNYVANGSIIVYICYTDESPEVNQPISICLYPKKASFAQNLNYPLSLKNNMKIEACCNKYRLVSPNYQGSFDFNVARNGGLCTGFIAECTYKPYTPYIKITPNFSYLYGGNFGDCRGLICGGDFSLGRINSAWESYELQNKNYQNIFNREIQNLDFEHSLQMRDQIVSSSVGVMTAAAAGAGTGAFLTGSWMGALAGGIVGGAGSGVGAIIDTDTLSKRQREAKSLAVDKYNYQLGNIKALPYTLTKVSAFDINSKIWPFLEYYTCTDAEKEALENKIAFESMTVMRIGYFKDYFKAFDTPRYFKGELIRCEDLAEDSHVLEAIYSELLKGVFM